VNDVGPSATAPVAHDAVLRHRRVPEREYADKVIAARPSDGAPVVLGATAAFVWRRLDDWTTVEELERVVGATYPEVPEAERVATQSEILAALEHDDLLERRSSPP
jgi:hypothetical protein